MRKLGLIAGGGTLPGTLASHCLSAGRSIFVVRLAGFADADLESFPGVEVGLAELGRCIRELKAAGCEAVCLAGYVTRPKLLQLRPDWRGLLAIPGVFAAMRNKGDDPLLRHLANIFEKEGFAVEGAHQVMGELTLPVGPLGKHKPSPEHDADIARALQVAREIGKLDVGQAAVSCGGQVLAVEAQDGTDAMLRRVAEMPESVRGTPVHPRGVLAKAPKPIQDIRMDMPTIGLGTLQRAARAGLAGIAGEAGKVLVLDRDQVTEMADELGLFIVGVTADPR
ncbi:MAG: UDP-2,3-diacylglucosamine diphosphatase LpxI [Caulobacteraceae bacterium]